MGKDVYLSAAEQAMVEDMVAARSVHSVSPPWMQPHRMRLVQAEAKRRIAALPPRPKPPTDRPARPKADPINATTEKIGGKRSNVAVLKTLPVPVRGKDGELVAFEGREFVDGMVHRPDCFIVTTRFPDRDWKPVQEDVTCGFCGKA